MSLHSNPSWVKVQSGIQSKKRGSLLAEYTKLPKANDSTIRPLRSSPGKQLNIQTCLFKSLQIAKNLSSLLLFIPAQTSRLSKATLEPINVLLHQRKYLHLTRTWTCKGHGDVIVHCYSKHFPNHPPIVLSTVTK